MLRRSRAPLVLLVGLALSPRSAAQCPLDKLTALSASAGDHFGHSVRIDGTTLVVGARAGDGAAADTGAVHVFEADPDGWMPSAVLAPLDGIAGDTFGYTTCLKGDVLLVGAPFADSSAVNAGAAYAFERTPAGWVAQGKLLPADLGPDDRFGFSIAIEGSTAFVSCHKDDDQGTDAGAFYVYELAAGTWTQTAKVFASDAKPFDDFGENVAISNGRAIVSAWGNDDQGAQAGAIYFLELGPTGWTEVQKAYASDGAAGDQFGAAVAMQGPVALAAGRLHDHGGLAGGAVYVFRHDGSTWSQSAELLASDGAPGDEFGNGVAISGARILVGAPFHDAAGFDSGAAYLFEANGSAWDEVAQLLPADGAPIDRLGLSVSLAGDVAVAGAPLDDDVASGAGSAYVWSASATGCPPLYAEPASLSVSAGGTQFFALRAGAAHGGEWKLLLGTVSGTVPGFPAGAFVLPLNPDGYFAFTLAYPNRLPLSGSFGFLDAQGTSQAQFFLPGGVTTGIAGVVVHHAYAALDPATLAVTLASNAERLALHP